MDKFVIILTILIINFVYYSHTLECNDVIDPDIQSTFKQLGCFG